MRIVITNMNKIKDTDFMVKIGFSATSLFVCPQNLHSNNFLKENLLSMSIKISSSSDFLHQSSFIIIQLSSLTWVYIFKDSGMGGVES